MPRAAQAFAIALTGAVGLGGSQSPAVPPPPAAATIRGTVIDIATKEPIRGALIRASGENGVFDTATDVNGRFLVRGVRAGRVRLTASKPRYVPQTFRESIDLAAGQEAAGIDFALPMAGVITGSVVDELGDPVAGAAVGAIPTLPGESAGATVSTDDRGEYRIGGLAAGRYVVRVRVPPPAIPERARDAASAGAPDGGSAFDLAEPVLVRGGEESGVPPMVGGGLVLDAPSPVSTAAGDGLAGTSVVGGVVSDDRSGKPIRRAVVRLERADRKVRVWSVTDESGRYRIQDLPAGRYFLTATKPSYLEGRYGQTDPGDAGRRFDLEDGQRLMSQSFRLSRGGVITGRIYDVFGDPIEGVRVRALHVAMLDGQRRVVATGVSARSDDTGWYRLFGLSPGPALVVADTTLPAGPDADPAYREGYVPTYAQGVADVGVADLLSIDASAPGRDVYFRLATGRTSSVSGIVLQSSGRPLRGGTVSLVSLPASDASLVIETSVRADGSFRLASVPPGDYLLTALGAGTTGGVKEAAVERLPIAGDVEALSIVTGPGGVISGTIRFEGDPPYPPVEDVPLMLDAIEFDGVPDEIQRLRFRSDGTFEIQGAMGSRVIRLRQPLGTWHLKRVVRLGRDITDEPLGSSRLDGAEVVLSNRLPAIEGTVRDRRGILLNNYAVFVFPTDRKLWVAGSRAMRVVSSNPVGEFEVEGLPPGRYFVAATRHAARFDANDQPLLKWLARSAERVSLTEGHRETLVLEFR